MDSQEKARQEAREADRKAVEAKRIDHEKWWSSNPEARRYHMQGCSEELGNKGAGKTQSHGAQWEATKKKEMVITYMNLRIAEWDTLLFKYH